MNAEQLCGIIQSAVKDSFSKPPHGEPGEISRHKLDEAQIIYSYLAGNSGSYSVISQEWLEAEDGAAVAEAVRELLEGYFEVAPS
ncbi:hypothetical protein D3C84_1197520 [compost metagenome]